MRCPSCHSNLKKYKYHNLVVDICEKCSGIWFDPKEMKDYIDLLLQKPTKIPHAEIKLDKKIKTPYNTKEKEKTCPHCNKKMERFNYAYDSNVILNKCTSCDGIWTDQGEIIKLARYIKGNPLITNLGKAIAEEQQKEINELADISGGIGPRIDSMLLLFLPRLILPGRDNIKTNIFPIVVVSIIAINISIFSYQIFGVATPDLFFNKYGLIPSIIMSGKGYFSLFSHIFLHGNASHLIGNIIFFWIFGDNVEEKLGHLRFIGFYILVGLLASIIYIFTNTNSDIPAIGASGAISGIMGAYLVLFPHARIKTAIMYRIYDIPAYFYLVVWIIIQIILATAYTSGTSGIAWFAHIGGFFSGVVLMLIYKKFIKRI